MSERITRFTPKQRVEHVLVMSVFLLLAITGFPQKFFESGWAVSVVNFLGGLDRVRFVHRVCGLVFSFLTVVHLASAVSAVLLGRQRLTLVPSRKDFRDAIQQLRYYFGLEERGAEFDRFDYRQKFEYWGLIFGGVVMIATGFVLYFPLLVTRFLPGELIPVAQVAHSNEGLMAFLVVIVWHIYNAHLSPEVFPFDTTIFTGQISRHRMEHEHPLELARLIAEGKALPAAPKPDVKEPAGGDGPAAPAPAAPAPSGSPAGDV